MYELTIPSFTQPQLRSHFTVALKVCRPLYRPISALKPGAHALLTPNYELQQMAPRDTHLDAADWTRDVQSATHGIGADARYDHLSCTCRADSVLCVRQAVRAAAKLRGRLFLHANTTLDAALSARHHTAPLP